MWRANEYFRAQCALSRIRHAAVVTRLASTSPHDEDERDGHRSPVHLITQRFPVTRQISILQRRYFRARLSTRVFPSTGRARIAAFCRYHLIASPGQYVNYRLISNGLVMRAKRNWHSCLPRRARPVRAARSSPPRASTH